MEASKILPGGSKARYSAVNPLYLDGFKQNNAGQKAGNQLIASNNTLMAHRGKPANQGKPFDIGDYQKALVELSKIDRRGTIDFVGKQ